MHAPRTSLTHPLQIAEVALPGGGTVGVTFMPGKIQPNAATGAWRRDLATDVSAIRDWGATIVITLTEHHEMRSLGTEALGAAVAEAGMTWLHLPIPDVSIPDAGWETQWLRDRVAVHGALDPGGKVLVHCKGGLGRAGTIAALILVERGETPEQAVAAVRRVRPGALETPEQVRYVGRAGRRHPWPPAAG